jgi:hypothetical protein
MLRPISPIAWIPVAIVLFGVGDLAAIYLIFLGAFFPIVVTTTPNDGCRPWALAHHSRSTTAAVACGMMSAPARSLMGLFGLRLEILGPEQMYWNESRAPVRFSLMSATRLVARAQGQLADPQPARTSARACSGLGAMTGG